jgi:hypothetical protein
MESSTKIEGCVYFFLDNNKKRDIQPIKQKQKHKFVKNDIYIRNELTNVLKIHQIPNFKKFFYVFENSYELTVKNSNNLKTIKPDNNLLLKFNNCELTSLKMYLQSLSSPKIYILKIIHFYKYLLNSIQLLVNNNIVHNHIHFDSIMIEKDCPLLSDFSFSFSTDVSFNNIKPFFIEYEPSYLEWPIEIHILTFLITNKLNSLSFSNIEHIITDVVNNHSILKTFGLEVVSIYKEEAISYFKKYINQTYDYILTDIFLYSSTWDNYALSILFLRILIGIHRTIGTQNKFIIYFMKLLVTNIHLNPLKRLSIATTTNKFEVILESIEPKDYKEIFDNL